MNSKVLLELIAPFLDTYKQFKDLQAQFGEEPERHAPQSEANNIWKTYHSCHREVYSMQFSSPKRESLENWIIDIIMKKK